MNRNLSPSPRLVFRSLWFALGSGCCALAFGVFGLPHSLAAQQAPLVVPNAASTTSEKAPVRITLSSPVEFQVFQRSSSAEGTLLLEGLVASGSGQASRAGSLPGSLSVRLLGKDLPGDWKPVPFDPRVPAFRMELKVPAGGWFRVEVCASNPAKPEALAAVEHVGVGEVFVVAGQSNSANYGEEKLQSSHPLVVALGESNSWQPCVDPQPGAGGKGGSFLPPFGDSLAEALGVPVGLVSCGVGATSVREWLPRGFPFNFAPTLTSRVVTVGRNTWESDGTLFARFSEKLGVLGKAGSRQGFRAVLWHQGESDANQADPLRTLPGAAYQAALGQLIRSSRLAAGWEVPWFVAQASYHGPGDEFSPEIRLAQRSLWEGGVALEGPDTDALTGALRERQGAGVHFSGAGQRAHAKAWAEKVIPWIQQQLTSSAGAGTKPASALLPVRLSPNPLFSDRMVLQREKRVPVWGGAPPQETVHVEFAGQHKTAVSDARGQWRVDLDPLEASEEPRSLVIRSEKTRLVLKEVLVGEVWLASGQSNMHWTLSHPIRNGAEELQAAQDPAIRQFTVNKSGAAQPKDSAGGGWHRANANELLIGSTNGDSALGYFFARELRRSLKVPVGVLNASVGGTPIESWANGNLFNGMIHPLAPYALRGALWYQGESNCLKKDGAADYPKLLTQMIQDWRALWKQGDFPFFYVQIAPWIYSARSKPEGPVLTPETLPEFWMAQTSVLRERNTGMVVIYDITDNPADIHPLNKQDVGKRLAAWALGSVYGRSETVFRNPLFESAMPEGGRIRVRFQYAEGGLTTRDGQSPSHVEVAGEDGVFHPATASIEGSDLLVRSEAVAVPKLVRYGWNEKAMPNLASKQGRLPVAPFHSGRWPLAVSGR